MIIYEIPVSGGQPVQVTHHVGGNLFWPSMSSDGKAIVYEEARGQILTIATERGDVTDQERDLMNRDIDNEAQGLAAEAAARQTGGRGGAGSVQPVDVRIDSNNLARLARRLTVPGTTK